MKTMANLTDSESVPNLTRKAERQQRRSLKQLYRLMTRDGERQQMEFRKALGLLPLGARLRLAVQIALGRS